MRFMPGLGACPTLPFVTRRMRPGQIGDRKKIKKRRLLTLIHRGFFEAENKADTCVSFAAVERSMLDSLRREHCLFPFHAMRFRKEVMPLRTRRSEKENAPLSCRRDCEPTF